MNLDALLAAVPDAVTETGFGPVSVDVPAARWARSVTCARDDLGCAFFDFLSAVDEGESLRVVCHVVRPEPFGHLVLRTSVPVTEPVLASVAEVYAGAAWHERETAEMFGVRFVTGAGVELAQEPLLLPPGFEGHPLRKEFALQARLDRPWPGDKEPGDRG